MSLSTGLGTLTPQARLLRGFATDFLTSHDPAEVERIMDPAYRLTIGNHVFDGRDGSYLPATAAQLELFPGLCVTVHDVVLGRDAVAMRFTEHGASTKDAPHAAAWGGVTLFALEGGRLTAGWAEEDYFARKRQLKSGACDPIAAPHPAPWDVPCLDPDDETDRLVRAWLARPDKIMARDRWDEISVEGPRLADLVDAEGLAVDMLFTAGPRAAFHAVLSGAYRGGFADLPTPSSRVPIQVGLAGLATVRDGAVADVQFVLDRLGLHRTVLNQASRSP